MSDDLFSESHLENYPCDSCGTTPSLSMGHGSFSCEKCYNSWWCPNCKYYLQDNHVCPTPEQKEKDKITWELANIYFGWGYAPFDQYIQSLNTQEELDILDKALTLVLEQVRSKKESLP